MNEQQRKIIEQAIHNLADLINQIEPDPEYREMYGVDSVLSQAQEALQILKQQGV